MFLSVGCDFWGDGVAGWIIGVRDCVVWSPSSVITSEVIVSVATKNKDYNYDTNILKYLFRVKLVTVKSHEQYQYNSKAKCTIDSQILTVFINIYLIPLNYIIIHDIVRKSGKI